MENGKALSALAEETLIFLFNHIGVSGTGPVGRETLYDHFEDRAKNDVDAALSELQGTGLVRSAGDGVALNGEAYVYLKEDARKEAEGSGEKRPWRRMIPVIIEGVLALAAISVLAMLMK